MKNGIAYHLDLYRKTKWFVIKAFDRGTQVGYIQVGLESDNNPGDDTVFEWSGRDDIDEYQQNHRGAFILYRLHVDAAYRRKGIASHLVKLALRQIYIREPFCGIFVEAGISEDEPSITLDILISFYRQFGFKLWRRPPRNRIALLHMSVANIWKANMRKRAS